jgi:hypothetical protein
VMTHTATPPSAPVTSEIASKAAVRTDDLLSTPHLASIVLKT